MPELNVKTFLQSSGQNDIRRFTLRTEDTSFVNLSEKVRSIYDLQPATFAILWKDADGDEITIANDNDVATMLKSSSDVLKLIVKRVATRPPSYHGEPMEGASSSQPQPQPEPEPVDPDLHRGVTCDGCNSALRGIRFKCLNCADFDLCESCYGKDNHKEHLMLRIPKPNMPWVTPLVFMSRVLRQAEEAQAQGRNYCHSAMGAMPNPQDFMDLNALGQQMSHILGGLGIDANYFVQPPSGARTPGSGCPFRGGNAANDTASSAAATAALERRVTETLEHLRAMGFQDDNGSLNNLVRLKKGDLFAVLDILKAQQTQ